MCQGDVTSKADFCQEEDPRYQLIQDRKLTLDLESVSEADEYIRDACQCSYSRSPCEPAKHVSL